MLFFALLISILTSSIVSWGDEGMHNQVIDKALDNFENKNASGPSIQPAPFPIPNEPLSNAVRPFAESTHPQQIVPVIDTLDVKETEIQDVLKTIAAKTGLNIVPVEDVHGLVTISLKNVDAYDTLRIVLSIRGLAYLQEADKISVMSAETYQSRTGSAFDQNLQTKIIPLQYAPVANVLSSISLMKGDQGKIYQANDGKTLILIDAPEKIGPMFALIEDLDVPVETEVFQFQHAPAVRMAKTIEKILSKNIGHVQYDERSNNVVVTDSSEKMKDIREMVKKLDKEEKEIVMEVKIVQITLNEEHLDGIDWEAIVSNFQKMPLPAGTSNPSDEDKPYLSLGTLTDEDYAVLMDALDAVGVINNISNIQIAADNDKEVEFIVKSTDLLALQNADIKGKEVPTIDMAKVVLTPIRTDQGFINIRLKAEMLDSGENQMPSAEVPVNLTNGSTVVIGGFHKEFTVESMHKVPLLGDLPFLGFAFRQHGEHVSKTEIIVFLTPKLIKKT